MSIFLIESIAFTRLVEGNRQEARAHARALNDEYQPAWGTTCRRIGRASLMSADLFRLPVTDVSGYQPPRRNG